jgi:bifunctional DNase/RNase
MKLQALALSLAIVAAFSWYLVYNENQKITGMAVYGTPELSVDGYLETSINLNTNSIVLVSGCRQLTLSATEEQINSIMDGAGGVVDFRPTSHDLINDVLEHYGIDVLEVKIENVQDGAYFSRLVVRQGDRFFSVDSRPSDAIALAVRQNAPVYVRSSLMEDYGKDACS